MKLSNRTREHLYMAIREPLVDARIKVKKSLQDHSNISSADVDSKIANAEQEIWRRVVQVLGLNEHVKVKGSVNV